MQPDDTEFSAFTEGLDYPMYVVTVARSAEPEADRRADPETGQVDPTTVRAGCLVGFGTQVSLDPPRFMVCISVENHTHALAMEAELLAVHLLSEDLHELAELFGGETGDEVDKFERWPWQPGPGPVPVLDACPRVLVGRVWHRAALGDHTGFVLEPVAVVVRRGDPGLTFHDVEDVDPGHPA